MRKYLVVLVVMSTLAFTGVIRAQETAMQQEDAVVTQEQAATVSPEATAINIEEPTVISPEVTPVSTETSSATMATEVDVTKETVMLEEESSIKELSGDVSSVDVTNSTLTIKYLKDEATQAYDEVSVATDENTLIEKDGLNAGLSDILVNEKANVEYVATKDGKNIASSIQIETQK